MHSQADLRLLVVELHRHELLALASSEQVLFEPSPLPVLAPQHLRLNWSWSNFWLSRTRN